MSPPRDPSRPAPATQSTSPSAAPPAAPPALPSASPSAATLPAVRGAAPVLRLVPYAFAESFGRPAAGVWSAPYVLRLSGPAGGPGTAVPLSWQVVVAAAPRADGVLRVGSINRPDEVAEIDLATGHGTLPAWARPVLAGTTGAVGLDLLVHTDLPDATGLSAAVPLSCAAALAEAAFHDPAAGGRRARLRLADPALGAVALFCRTGHLTLIEDDAGALEHVPFDPDRRGLRFVLAVPRWADMAPERGEPVGLLTGDQAGGPTPVCRNALAAGAIEARPLGAGGTTIALAPGRALAAVRRAMVGTYTRAGEPAPRVLSAAIGSPCVRVA
ncbi:hypothetical protein [Embleya sp. NBC_00896]|uniref:hypothetical protein n=1 Tax=Embleya sp. NBC_00896 TaxID=2975961 RepID=UPI00386FC50A|nr:hypothetical protein OG928_10155 [Embleya sp. NBC_00896]